MRDDLVPENSNMEQRMDLSLSKNDSQYSTCLLTGSYVMAVGPRPEVHTSHDMSHDTSHDIPWIRCVILMF